MVLQYTILCLGYGAFGVTTIFNFPSKSYVKFSFCQRNQWSMRLGLSSGRTWMWMWMWTEPLWLANQPVAAEVGRQSQRRILSKSLKRNRKLCRAKPKWALRKICWQIAKGQQIDTLHSGVDSEGGGGVSVCLYLSVP